MPISNDMITLIKEVLQMDDALIELRFNLECLSLRKTIAMKYRDMLTRGRSAPSWWSGDMKGWVRTVSVLELLSDVGLLTVDDTTACLLYTSGKSELELQQLLDIPDFLLR